MSSQGWFNCWEIVAATGTAIVIAGLFIEYGLGIFAFLKLWGERKKFAYRVKVETPREHRGSALVVFGITVELLGAAGMFVQSLRVETQRQATIAALSHETSVLTSANVELERILLPRRVAFDRLGREFGTLRQFSNTNVMIVSVPDLEAMRLANDILAAVSAAGWIAQSVTLGVGQSAVHFPSAVRIVSSMDEPQHRAAWILSAYLWTGYLSDLGLRSTAGIQNHCLMYVPNSGWWPPEISPTLDTVFVFIGMKPIGGEIKDLDSKQQLSDKIRQFFDSSSIPWNPGEEWP